IAAWNCERYVEEAMSSILRQTYTDIEIVFVDDGSTDRTRELATASNDPRIRVVVNDANIGQTRSLNRGLAETRGELIARMDGDDVLFPECLAKQVAWLDAHRDVAALGVQAMPIDGAGRRLRRIEWWNAQWRRPVGALALEWYRMFDTPLFHSGAMIRRDVLADELGGYSESHSLNQDADLWRRMAKRHRLANLDATLLASRQHRGSMTADRGRAERQGHAELKTAIVHELMSDVLQWPDVPRRWAELWVDLTNLTKTISPDELRELMTAIDRCFARFVELHPEAGRDREIARHRASILARAMRKRSDRGLALLLFSKMFVIDPMTALRISPRALLHVAFRR